MRKKWAWRHKNSSGQEAREKKGDKQRLDKWVDSRWRMGSKISNSVQKLWEKNVKKRWKAQHILRDVLVIINDTLHILRGVLVMEDSRYGKYMVVWYLRAKQVIYEKWLRKLWEKPHKYEKNQIFFRNGVFAYSDAICCVHFFIVVTLFTFPVIYVCCLYVSQHLHFLSFMLFTFPIIYVSHHLCFPSFTFLIVYISHCLCFLSFMLFTFPRTRSESAISCIHHATAE